jgi:hypothetical protein
MSFHGVARVEGAPTPSDGAHEGGGVLILGSTPIDPPVNTKQPVSAGHSGFQDRALL